MPLITSEQVWTRQPQTVSSIKPYWLGRGLYSVNIGGLGDILSPPQPLPADSTITNSSVGKLVSQATESVKSYGIYMPKRLLTERTEIFVQVCKTRKTYGKWLHFESDYWKGEYTDTEISWNIHGDGWASGYTIFSGVSPISLVGAPVCIAGVWGKDINGGAGRVFVNAKELTNNYGSYTGSSDRTLSSAETTGGPYQQVSGIALYYAFSKALSTAEIKVLSENPWSIFQKKDSQIWIPSAGGGGVTIACTPGGATTAGVSAGVSSATTLACNVGGATTAGITAGISAVTTIACSVGDASTAGISCSIPVVVQCGVGTATTAGVSASISLDSSITISCNAGNATTAGIVASFPQTLSCTPGNATTAGNSATFPQSLSCNVGNATTAGITAQVEIAGQIVIGCNAGTATTAGVSADISSAFILACNVGNATTIGATAYFPQSLQCTPGNAIALGVNATFTVSGPTTIVCSVGNATASGISFSFGGTLVDAPNGSGPSIIRPQTIRPPNLGGIRI